MLGLVRDAFPYRNPGPQYGRYGSLVMVAPCNLACSYCDVGGYAKDEHNNLPGHRLVETKEIEAFVREEADRGRIIYFTGGEPLMFSDLIFHLAQIVKSRGGYSVVCSNATLYKRMQEVSPFVDEFSISLKGDPAIAERVAGVRGRLAFDIPYQNTLKLLDLPNRLELVVVLFKGMTFESFVTVYRPLMERAFLALKQYRPKVTTTAEDHTYVSTELASEVGDVEPMNWSEMMDLFDRLNSSFPEHSSRVNLILGGGGEQTVLNQESESLFIR